MTRDRIYRRSLILLMRLIAQVALARLWSKMAFISSNLMRVLNIRLLLQQVSSPHSVLFVLQINDQWSSLSPIPDFGHFEFTTYHYGLKNAQRELQTLIESVLLDETNQNYITIYMGRILVHTQSSEHHFDLLEDIFWRLQNSNLLIDFAESAFLTNRIDYLGYFINSTGVWLTENQANKIAHFNEPCSKRDVRSFLGLTSRYKE